MEPLVEGLKKQYEGKVEFRRLNVDGSDPAATELATKLGVQYVPHFTYVNSDGIVGSQAVGEKTTEELKAGIDALQ
ncbi:MAG: hypothetical protein HY876_04635 [Coriobacteriales bacterium]|nr:hypothetical protein [Coriobacteriales bacterium]